MADVRGLLSDPDFALLPAERREVLLREAEAAENGFSPGPSGPPESIVGTINAGLKAARDWMQPAANIFANDVMTPPSGFDLSKGGFSPRVQNVEEPPTQGGRAVAGVANPMPGDITAAGQQIGMLLPGGVAGRVLGATGGAALGSILSGKPWNDVSTDAALAGGVTGGMEGLGKLFSYLSRATGGAKSRIANTDADQLFGEVRTQAPGLTRADVPTGTPSEQLRSLATGSGRRGIGAEKEQVVRGIEELTGGAAINVPSLRKDAGTIQAEPSSPMWEGTAAREPSKVSLREANEALTEIGDGLRHTDIGDRRLREQLIQRDYKKLADEIRTGLDELAPGLGAVWNVGQENARAGYALVKMLRNPNAWRAGNNGVELNTAYLQSKLLNPKVEEGLNWRLKEGGFESLADTLTRGAGVGHVDINSSGRGGMGQSVGELTRRPSAGTMSGILTPLRAIVPNAGAKLVGAPGRVPGALDPSTQALMDYLAQQAMEQARREGVQIGDTYGRR